MLKFLCLFLCTLLLFTTPIQGHTWNSSVAEIFEKKCSTCHTKGGVGHFSINNYDFVKQNSEIIRYVISENLMPPWPPNKDFGHFKIERILSEYEKATLLNWIDKQCPKGEFIGVVKNGNENTNHNVAFKPDIKIEIPTYTVKTQNDEFRAYVIKNPFQKGIILKSIKINPGCNFIHHISFLQDPTSFSDSLQRIDTVNGFEFNGLHATSPSAKLICGWAPGAQLFSLPDNIGITIEKNTDFLIEVHYGSGVKGMKCNTSIEIELCKDNNHFKEAILYPLIFPDTPCLQNPPFLIQKDSFKSFIQKTVLKEKITVLMVAPHMHLAGQSYKVFAVSLSGDTVPIIDIPRWNPHWQELYELATPLQLEAGTTIWGIAKFNNTKTNPYLTLPTKELRYGPSNNQEMMHCAFLYINEENNENNNQLLLSAFLLVLLSVFLIFKILTFE